MTSKVSGPRVGIAGKRAGGARRCDAQRICASECRKMRMWDVRLAEGVGALALATAIGLD